MEDIHSLRLIRRIPQGVGCRDNKKEKLIIDYLFYDELLYHF